MEKGLLFMSLQDENAFQIKPYYKMTDSSSIFYFVHYNQMRGTFWGVGPTLQKEIRIRKYLHPPFGLAK